MIIQVIDFSVKNKILSTFHYYASINSNIGGDGGAIRPLPGDRDAEKLHGDPRVEPHPKVWTRSQKMEEVMPNMARREARMRNNPVGGDLDPADDVRRRCKKNSSFILSCIDKKTKEGCDNGSEIGTVHSERDRKGQFL